MVSADSSGPTLDARLVPRAHRAVEPLHSQVYFAPELEEHLGALGLKPGRQIYFAGRAAPMGAVGHVPPTQTGMRGRWTGGGWHSAPQSGPATR